MPYAYSREVAELPEPRRSLVIAKISLELAQREIRRKNRRIRLSEREYWIAKREAARLACEGAVMLKQKGE